MKSDVPKSLTVYLDESGFTGNNLLDNDQPIFVVSAVSIGAVEAAELVAEVVEEFQLDALELKGSRLCDFLKGQQAVVKILTSLAGKFRFVVINKRYAAACKVFEYLIEPTISECGWFFYSQKLNYFVADEIYYRTKTEYKEILANLSIAIRKCDPEIAFNTLEALSDSKGEPAVLRLLKEVVANNRAAILDEFKSLKELDSARWVMDLSSTALFSLLCTWAEQDCPLDVHCDDSKPLASIVPGLSARIGAKSDMLELPSGDKYKLFVLANAIKLENSSEIPGLQLADVVASSVMMAMKSPNSDFSHKVQALAVKYIDPSSMSPGSRPFTASQAQHMIDLLVLIAQAQKDGMTPCQKLKDIAEKIKKRRG